MDDNYAGEQDPSTEPNELRFSPNSSARMANSISALEVGVRSPNPTVVNVVTAK